jgi:hypothetical protein
MTGDVRRVYAIAGAGGFEVNYLEHGDLTVWHPYNEKLQEILFPLLKGRGRFDGPHRNWIVFKQYGDAFFADVEQIAQRLV